MHNAILYFPDSKSRQQHTYLTLSFFLLLPPLLSTSPFYQSLFLTLTFSFYSVFLSLSTTVTYSFHLSYALLLTFSVTLEYTHIKAMQPCTIFYSNRNSSLLHRMKIMRCVWIYGIAIFNGTIAHNIQLDILRPKGDNKRGANATNSAVVRVRKRENTKTKILNAGGRDIKSPPYKYIVWRRVCAEERYAGMLVRTNKHTPCILILHTANQNPPLPSRDRTEPMGYDASTTEIISSLSGGEWERQREKRQYILRWESE